MSISCGSVDLALPSCVCLFCSSIFWLPQRLLSERELLLVVLGLSFYRLEQTPNRMIYAMSKIGTATSGLIFVSGLCPSLGSDARRCCQKILLLNSGSNSLGSFWNCLLLALGVELHD